jgi:hypothetical protein
MLIDNLVQVKKPLRICCNFAELFPGVISTLSVKTCTYVRYVTRKVALQADIDVVDTTKRTRKRRMEILRSLRYEQD